MWCVFQKVTTAQPSRSKWTNLNLQHWSTSRLSKLLKLRRPIECLKYWEMLGNFVWLTTCVFARFLSLSGFANRNNMKTSSGFSTIFKLRTASCLHPGNPGKAASFYILILVCGLCAACTFMHGGKLSAMFDRWFLRLMFEKLMRAGFYGFFWINQYRCVFRPEPTMPKKNKIHFIVEQGFLQSSPTSKVYYNNRLHKQWTIYLCGNNSICNPADSRPLHRSAAGSRIFHSTIPLTPTFCVSIKSAGLQTADCL